MANPLESVIQTAQKVPPIVWIGGGTVVVGIVAYRVIRGNVGGTVATATPPSVTPVASSQASDLAAVAGELGNQETQAISAIAQQSSDQQAALATLLQSQQQSDAQANQGLEQTILGGLNAQESQYQALQGQTEQYLTQNQQSFSQAAATFGQAQQGMASSLSDLWSKLSQAQAVPPAPAPVDTGPTQAQIAQNASGLGIPVFDIQAFAGVYHHLPGSIPELDNYLDSVGLRNPTGKLAMPV